MSDALLMTRMAFTKSVLISRRLVKETYEIVNNFAYYLTKSDNCGILSISGFLLTNKRIWI